MTEIVMWITTLSDAGSWSERGVGDNLMWNGDNEIGKFWMEVGEIVW
jgi:hypothetical protein